MKPLLTAINSNFEHIALKRMPQRTVPGHTVNERGRGPWTNLWLTTFCVSVDPRKSCQVYPAWRPTSW